MAFKSKSVNEVTAISKLPSAKITFKSITQRKEAKAANTILLYGPSRSGKTREFAALALYIWRKYKKKTRYITLDGGTAKPLLPLVEAGMVDMLDFNGDVNVVNSIRAISTGIWPELDPKTGERHWQAPENQKTLSDVGMIGFESISAYSKMLMDFYIRENVSAAEALVGLQTLENPDEELARIMEPQVIGKLSRAHYGLLAQELNTFIINMNSLQPKYGLELIAYSTHDNSSEKETAGIKFSVLGPSSEGQKFGQDLPKLVGDMIYMTYTKTGKGLEYHAAFAPYADKQLGNKLWPASLRGDADVLSQLYKDPRFDKGYLVLTDEDDPVMRKGITELLEARDLLESNATQKIKLLMEQK